MFRFFLMAATALGLTTAQAIGDGLRIERPGQAASLNAKDVDLVTYFGHDGWNRFAVTATFAERAGHADPVRVRLALGDGDHVAFSMPGYPDQLFHFARTGDAVDVRLEEIKFAEVAQIE